MSGMARHIVIVEDEATIRHNYEDALRRYGYRVTGFGDRPSALATTSRAASSCAASCAGCRAACRSSS
jgi:two-component system OmpR family response regulator